MKLAYLSDVDESTIHDLKFLEEFSKHYEVYVISFSRRKVIWKNNVWHIPSGRISFYLRWKEMRKILDGISPDVVFANYITKYPILYFMSCAKYPLISVGWGSDIIYQASFPPFSFLVKKVCEKSCCIIVDSEYCKKLLKKFGCSDKTEVIPFGVDTEKFKPGKYRDEIRKKEGLEDKTVVISLRNHYKLYNIETILKAARYFDENVFLLIAGKGPRTKKLRKIVEKYSLKNVRFLGFLNRDDVAKYLDAADIFISVPFWDSTSVSLLEAMASGCIPILSDIPANREWVENGKNGYIVGVKDYRKIAEVVNKIHLNPEVMKEMIIINREIVEKKADRKKNIFRIMEIIERCSKR